MQNKQHLEELAQFIRTHRNNENNFDVLYERLVAECEAAREKTNSQTDYADNLDETLEKHATLYRQNKEKGISTYAEFENMVSHFEKSVTDALNQS
jgi:ribosomal protein L16 Arg81 hydroxylase